MVSGSTPSPDWVSGGFDTTLCGGSDAFVAKLTPSGTHLWSTYLGGDDGDYGTGIAVDPSGNVVVTGYTESPDWVSGGFDTTLGGGSDAFVAKLSPSGTHLWSTYVGGDSYDGGWGGIAVDPSGNVVVSGSTHSPDWVSGGFDTTLGGGQDAFVAKLSGIPTGVTVITHGWQLATPSESGGNNAPEWTLEMANYVLQRAGGTGSIFVNDTRSAEPTFGSWVPLSELDKDARDFDSWPNTNSTHNEIVLVYDWVWDSNDTEEGWIQAAADNLFASLANAPLGLGTSVFKLPLHFIGHSRGAVVNSLVTNLIGQYFPNTVIDQVTSLDPHPIEADRSPYEADDPVIFTADDERAIPTYANVQYADNYYRHDGSYQDADFDGVVAVGARNIELNEDVLDEGLPFFDLGHASEHSDTHLWYSATIQPNNTTVEGQQLDDEEAAGWWDSGTGWLDSSQEPASGRAEVGFRRSRIGGGDRSGLDNYHEDRNEVASPGYTVFNGSFDFGDLSSDEIPGWERHGGGGNGQFNNNSNPYLELDFGSEDYYRTHNPLYFPQTVRELTYDLSVVTTSTTDTFQVYVGGLPVGIAEDLTQESGGFTIHPRVDVSSFSGGVNTLKLQIDSTDSFYPKVRVDNVNLLVGPIADAGCHYFADEGTTITLNASGSYDPDGTIVSYAWDLDDDGLYDDASGVTAAFSSTGPPAHVKVKVTDQHGYTDTSSTWVTINPVNNAPTLDVLADHTWNENAPTQSIALSGIGAGEYESQALRITAISSDESKIQITEIDYTSPAATGTLKVTPLADQSGTTTITVTVEDGGHDGDLDTLGDNATFSRTFDITVNAIPTLNMIDDLIISEDASEQTVNLTGIGAGGGELQPLKVTASSNHPLMIADLLVTYTTAEATGILRFTPTPNLSGTATITVTVEDGGPDGDLNIPFDNATFSRTLDVTVNPINDAPTLDALTDLTINEDAAQQTVNLTGITAGSGESQPLKVTATSDNTGLIPHPAETYTTAEATGSLKFTPVTDQSGTATITVTVEDGGLDGELATTADNGSFSRTFDVIVNPVNDAPTIDSLDSLTIDEDAAEQTVDLAGISAGGDESQPLSVKATSDNTGLILNPIVTYSSANTTGSLTFTPLGDQSGTATITVTVEDGGLDGELATTADNGSFSRTFDVIVNPVNDAPTIDSLDSLTIDEDAAEQTVDLAGISAGGDESQPLSVKATSDNTGLILNPIVTYSSANTTGSLTFTPLGDQSGTATITVTVEDGGLDGELATTADNGSFSRTFDVMVKAVNDAPELDEIGNHSIRIGQTLTFQVGATDLDTPSSSLEYSLGTDAPSGAAIGTSSGVFTWSPSVDVPLGIHIITVRVVDNGSPSLDDTQQFVIVVDRPSWQNSRDIYDVDDDGRVGTRDLVLLASYLHSHGIGSIEFDFVPAPYVDIDDNGRAQVRDLALIAERVRKLHAGSSEPTEFDWLDDIFFGDIACEREMWDPRLIDELVTEKSLDEIIHEIAFRG